MIQEGQNFLNNFNIAAYVCDHIQNLQKYLEEKYENMEACFSIKRILLFRQDYQDFSFNPTKSAFYDNQPCSYFVS